MAIVLKDRVKVASGVTGTGTATLGSAATGYQTFAAIGTGNQTYYTIALQSGDEWEVGLGTVTNTAGTYTLSRDTVYESSNAGTLVNFSAGTKDVSATTMSCAPCAPGELCTAAGATDIPGSGATGVSSCKAANSNTHGGWGSWL